MCFLYVILTQKYLCVLFEWLLSSAKDPTSWKLFDSCLELMKSRMESRELDKEVCLVQFIYRAIFKQQANINIKIKNCKIKNQSDT